MGKNDFFLEPDDAKTLGDVDYMRKPNRVKHTFPKTKANGGSFSIEKEVNAMEERRLDGKNFATGSNATSSTGSFGADSNGASSNGTSPSFSSEPKFSPKAKTETSMDMFRNMAKKMKR
jgi:hypothetical protein